MMNFLVLFLFIFVKICFGDETVIDVPNVDINAFLNGDIDVQRNIATVIDNALSTYGVFGIINHGINDELINAIFRNGKAFFKSELEYKMTYLKSDNDINGYTPLSNETFSYYKPDGKQSKIGYVEAFHLFDEFGDPVFGHKTPKEFEGILEQYYDGTKQVIYNVHKMVTKAMKCIDVDDIFAANMSKGFIDLRVSHYPPISSKNDTHCRFGNHKDWTGFTLVKSDYVEGFELYSDKLGKWLKVREHKDNNILVIAGEFIPMWTNGRWISPVHRVVSYKETVTDADTKISILSFTSVSLDSLIDILPCQINSNIDKRMYQPITGINHWNERINKSWEIEMEADISEVVSKHEL